MTAETVNHAIAEFTDAFTASLTHNHRVILPDDPDEAEAVLARLCIYRALATMKNRGHVEFLLNHVAELTDELSNDSLFNVWYEMPDKVKQAVMNTNRKG